MGKINIGEGISIIGIMIAVALTENYWLLFFMALPIFTWQGMNDTVNNEINQQIIQKNELDLKIKTEELRLLKVRKK